MNTKNSPIKHLRYLLGDRPFHRNFWPFWGFLLLQNLLSISVNLLDNVMLGGYSEAALAGAAAVNQIHFILQCGIGGAGDGMVILNSHYWGQKRTEPIMRITAAALWFSMSVALLLFAAVSIFPRGALGLFTGSEEFIEQGVAYLSILRFTFPIFTLSSVLLAMLRSVETVKVAAVVSVAALGVNAILNYTFIYGHFGAPAMGARGAALATLISRVIELAIIAAYLIFFDDKIKVKLHMLLMPIKALTKDYFKVSIPTIFVGLQWGVNTALQTVILGHMEDAAIAANSIAVNLMMMLKVMAQSSSAAGGVIIGKTVGEGNIAKVKQYARTLQLIFIGIGVTSGAGILLLRAPVLGLYRVSDTTMALAWSFLSVLAVTTMGMSYQMPNLTGIIRGGGDTRFVMIVDVISVWGIVIPLSALAAFVLKWPPVAVVICLNADQVFKCIPAAIKVNRFTWIKKLTRET